MPKQSIDGQRVADPLDDLVGVELQVRLVAHRQDQRLDPLQRLGQVLLRRGCARALWLRKKRAQEWPGSG